MIISAKLINPHAAILADYLAPYNGDRILLESRLRDTLSRRPIHNRAGTLLKDPLVSDICEWLCRTSYTDVLRDIVADINSMIKPYSGLCEQYSDTHSCYLTIELGSMPQDKVEPYMLYLQDILENFNGALKSTKIQVILEKQPNLFDKPL